MKLSDVRMRGRGFTLSVAAGEMGIPDELASKVLYAIYKKANMVNENGYLWDFVGEEQRQQPMATFFTADELNYSAVEGVSSVTEMLNENLIVRSGDGYQLTEKMVNLLKRAAEIQIKLDADDFYSCPCHSY